MPQIDDDSAIAAPSSGSLFDDLSNAMARVAASAAVKVLDLFRSGVAGRLHESNGPGFLA